MWIEPGIFEPLTAALTKRGYEPFSSPGDRHGSWEWPFFKKSGEMTRFVILAATPVDNGANLEVEFWIGAEADQRFARRRVDSLRLNPEQAAVMEERLSESLELAVEKANTLGLSDLTEQYAFKAQAVSVRNF